MDRDKMNIRKTALTIAMTTALGISATASQAAIIDLDFTGLYTLLDNSGIVLANTSKPYYYDATWGYGVRTQISGTLQFDTYTGAGTGTINPFEFMNGGLVNIVNFELQAIGDGVGGTGSLVLANMVYNWNNNPAESVQVVLDAAGLFTSLADGIYFGTPIDAASCAASGACATPASNDIKKLQFPIGPVPISTTSFNAAGATGYGTTLGQLSLGTDDGIGGSPIDNGVFSTFNANFDFTSLTVAPIALVPVPAAVWLFGSGLLGLAGLARRRKIKK